MSPPYYDIVLIDAFDADGLASSVQHSGFLQATESLLRENGVFCINLWSTHAEIFQSMMEKVRGAFSHGAFALPVRGQCNAIGFGLKGNAAKLSWRECGTLAKEIQEKLGIEFLSLVQGAPTLPWDKRFQSKS